MTEAGKALRIACCNYQAQVDVLRAAVAGDLNDFYHNNELSLNEKLWFECGKKHGVTEHYYKKVYFIKYNVKTIFDFLYLYFYAF